MGVLVGLALLVVSGLAAPSSSTVVAKPEASTANVVHVGQTLVIPLYDGRVVSANGALRLVGNVRIARHDLRRDLGGRSARGGLDASSDRGEAFVVERAGSGSVDVLLRLPRLAEPCASCRTVHFYYRAG
jgi:hypothetical protein